MSEQVYIDVSLRQAQREIMPNVPHFEVDITLRCGRERKLELCNEEWEILQREAVREYFRIVRLTVSNTSPFPAGTMENLSSALARFRKVVQMPLSIPFIGFDDDTSDYCRHAVLPEDWTCVYGSLSNTDDADLPAV